MTFVRRAAPRSSFALIAFLEADTRDRLLVARQHPSEAPGQECAPKKRWAQLVFNEHGDVVETALDLAEPIGCLVEESPDFKTKVSPYTRVARIHEQLSGDLTGLLTATNRREGELFFGGQRVVHGVFRKSQPLDMARNCERRDAVTGVAPATNRSGSAHDILND